MENENLVNAGSEVTVEPQNTEGAAQTAVLANGTPEGGQSQSKEENAAFAAMRRQYEQDISAKEGRLSKLDQVAKAAGYGTIEDMLDSKEAEEAGVTLEEFRNSRKAEADQRKQDILDSEEYRAMKAKYDELVGKASAENISRQMKADLDEIQKVFPDVKNLEELGDIYNTLISSGTDAVTAARAALAARVKAPKDIGAVGKQAPPAGEYYSAAQIEYYNDHPEAVRKLSDAEFAKLRESMSKS